MELLVGKKKIVAFQKGNFSMHSFNKHVQVIFDYSRQANQSIKRVQVSLSKRPSFSLYFHLYNYKNSWTNNKFYCIGCPQNKVVHFLPYRKLFHYQKKGKKMSYQELFFSRRSDYIC